MCKLEFENNIHESKNNDMIYVKEKEIDKICESILMIKNMSQDMSNLLDQETEKIDTIEDNIDNTSLEMDKADKELTQISKLVKGNSYIKSTLTTGTCTLIGAGIGSIGGPVGIAIGTGVGGGVGIVISLVSKIMN